MGGDGDGDGGILGFWGFGLGGGGFGGWSGERMDGVVRGWGCD